MCFGVKILNFGVAKSGISVFLVSGENGAGVNKKTNTDRAEKSLLDFAHVNTGGRRSIRE